LRFANQHGNSLVTYSSSDKVLNRVINDYYCKTIELRKRSYNNSDKIIVYYIYYVHYSCLQGKCSDL